MFVYGKCECFIIEMLYVGVLCASHSSTHASFCMTCHLIMLIEDARGDHMEEAYTRAGHDCLVGSHECLLLFTPSCCSECLYICRGVCTYTDIL